MLKICEGTIWPPKPEDISLDESSLGILKGESTICSPGWARASELGAAIGEFLIGNMDSEAACAIANSLDERLDDEDGLVQENREFLMIGIRNAINITSAGGQLSKPRVVIDEGRLAPEGVMA